MYKNKHLPPNRQTLNSNVFIEGKTLKTIFKIKNNQKNGVTISESLLQDERLSYKARGILGYLLSLPNDWKVNLSHLAKKSPQGIKAVRSSFKELRRLGYAKLGWVKDGNNNIKSQYFISELPKKDWAKTNNPEFVNISPPMLVTNHNINFISEIHDQLSSIPSPTPLEKQLEDYIYNTYTLKGSKPSGDIKGYLALKNKGLTITGFLFKQVALEKYGRADLIELNKNQDNTFNITIYELKRYSLNFKTIQQIIKYSNGIKNLLKSVYGNIDFSYSIQFKLIGYKSELEGFDHKKLNIELITYHFNNQNGFHFNTL